MCSPNSEEAEIKTKNKVEKMLNNIKRQGQEQSFWSPNGLGSNLSSLPFTNKEASGNLSK